MEGSRRLRLISNLWKAPRVLLLIGGVLFLSGQGFLAASFLQGTQGTVASIPAGPAWFYVYEIKVLGSSRVSGQFADLAGDVVNLYVFGERQYEVYAFIGLGRSPDIRDLLPRLRARRRIRGFGAGRPGVVSGRGNRTRVHGRRSAVDRNRNRWR